jgi:NAD(P)-dependent dehydrogenase (short-subunit alcohol dehydrogenase family)
MRLKGKTAIVTGASSGIGRAIALLFAGEGAHVAVVANLNQKGVSETAKEIQSMGGRAFWTLADVSMASAANQLVERALEEFGRIDILVNNAGIGGRQAGSRSLLDTSEEAWDRILAVNLKSVFLVSKPTVRHMVQQKGGAVINIASVFGMAGFAGISAYGAAKSGIIHLTRSMAIDYGPLGIRVNAIAPGVIQTRMIEEHLKDPGYQKLMVEAVPLGRLGTPTDVAYGALFLASDEASYINGHTLVIDGGWLV